MRSATDEPVTPDVSEALEKQCPQCDATVLSAARVCKHCRYRFDDVEAPPSGSSNGRRWIAAAIAGGVAVVAAAVIISSGGGGTTTGSTAGSPAPVTIPGTQIASEIQAHLGSRLPGVSVTAISCPGTAELGGSIDCAVTLTTGRQISIRVLVTGTAAAHYLKITVPQSP